MRGMWVLSPGETMDTRKVGVSPGQDWTNAKDDYSPDEIEMIYCNYVWIMIVYDWLKC